MPTDDDDMDWEEDLLDDPAEDEEYSTRCPACGAEIYEDTPQCPVCGEYVTLSQSHFWNGKPAWYLLLGILGIFAVITTMLVVW